MMTRHRRRIFVATLQQLCESQDKEPSVQDVHSKIKAIRRARRGLRPPMKRHTRTKRDHHVRMAA